MEKKRGQKLFILSIIVLIIFTISITGCGEEKAGSEAESKLEREIISVDSCLDQGGIIIEKAGPRDPCTSDEINLGKVKGASCDDCYCCKEKGTTPPSSFTPIERDIVDQIKCIDQYDCILSEYPRNDCCPYSCGSYEAVNLEESEYREEWRKANCAKKSGCPESICYPEDELNPKVTCRNEMCEVEYTEVYALEEEEEIEELEETPSASRLCSNEEYYTQAENTVTGEGEIFLNYLVEMDFKEKVMEEGNPALRGISDLTCITRLDLSWLPISDISPISELKSLKELNLGRTEVSDLSILSTFTKLERLDLTETPASDLSPLSSLLRLKYLNLEHIEDKDLSPLRTLIELEELVLLDAFVTDISPIDKLTNLKVLDMRGVRKVSDFSALAKLINLNELKMVSTSITDVSPLSTLTNLKELDLSKTKVSDISGLNTLTNLEILKLEETLVSDLSPLSSLTNLRELDLLFAEVTDVSPLSSLTNLEKLQLARNSISDISPLSTLTKLKSLDLQATKVSDISPLKNLKNLESLNINNVNCEEVRRELPVVDIYCLE